MNSAPSGEGDKPADIKVKRNMDCTDYTNFINCEKHSRASIHIFLKPHAYIYTKLYVLFSKIMLPLAG